MIDDRTGRIFVNRTHPGTWNFDNNIYFLSGVGYDKSWVPNDAINDTPLPSFADWQAYGSHNYDVQSKTANPSFTNFGNSNYSLQNSSPAVLSGVWVGLNSPYDHDISGTKIGNPPDIGAYQNSTYLAGTLSSNQTISGNVAITGNLTVPSNRTLTISPETHIKVGNGVNITANGIIDCQYNSELDNIKFEPLFSNDHGGSIIFDGSSAASSILQHVNIRQGGGIQCLNGANVLIENSRLDSCTLGIYIYNSAPQIINNIIYDPVENAISGSALNLSPVIKGNVMTKITNQHEWEGIYLGPFTYPYVANNDIRYFDFGIYIGGGSTGYFYDTDGTTPNPNNRFRDNVTGICSGWGSTIWAGNDADADSGCFNTILNNSTAAKSYQYSGLYAWNNYWGPENNLPPYFNIYENSFIQWDNHRTSDPWDQGNSAQHKSGDPLISNNHLGKSITGDNLYTGIQLEKDGKIDDAITFYKILITNDKYVRIALSQLSHIKYKYNKIELADYFESLLTSNRKYYSTVKNVIGGMYLQNNQFDNAMAAYDDVIKNYSIEYDGISARFEKLFASLNIKKDPVTASQLLSEIKGLNSNEEEVQINIKIAEDLIYRSNKVLGKNIILLGDNIPKLYGLYQNYPNPFNPSTIIRYQIPKPGLVTLKVYDILGKEVATLVNENKIEGSYDFSLNASRFASGVYIYQLRVNDYVSSKKMILLK
jgi:parallel beta-helix repeat protein